MTNTVIVITNVIVSNIGSVSAPSTVDYNWFYSTVAQSYAAFCGVLLAFFISNIFSELKEYENYIEELNIFIIQLNKIPYKSSNTEYKKSKAEFSNLLWYFEYLINKVENYKMVTLIDLIIFVVVLSVFIFGVTIPINCIPTNNVGQIVRALPSQKFLSIVIPCIIMASFVIMLLFKCLRFKKISKKNQSILDEIIIIINRYDKVYPRF